MGFIGKVFRGLFKATGCLLMLIGLGVVLFVAGLLYAFMDFEKPVMPSVPDRFVLTLDLDEMFFENQTADIFSLLAPSEGLSLKSTIKAIKNAAEDDSVIGLYAKVGASSLGMAQAEELREALLAFRASKKPMAVWSETIGMDGTGTQEYYLASAFPAIYLQPSGDVNFVGLSLQNLFFKGLLTKLGIATDFYARYEYKGFGESAAADKMSLPVKQNMKAVAESLYGQVVAEVAKARAIPEADVKALVNRAPLSAVGAKAAKLVDELYYQDEAAATFKAKDFIPMQRYINTQVIDEVMQESKGKIALLYVSGMIVSGRDNSSPFGGSAGYVAAADDVADTLEEIAKDKEVKAVVMRIDSSGGSYTAADVMWHAVKAFREKHKIPVVASMGNVAASGGYMVAAAADKIVADGLSITGSIGVFGGKPVIAEMLKKIGVSVDGVSMGDNADMMSIDKPFSPSQAKMFEASLDRVYADFTAKVGAARGLDKTAMDKIARGRVFTGAEAKQVGLVDELGGFYAAVKLAADMAGGLPESFELVPFPKAKTPLEMMYDFLESGGSGMVTSPSVFFMRLGRQVSIMDAAPKALALPVTLPWVD